MSTPLWRQIIEGTYDPFGSAFEPRQSSGGGFEGLQTDWRAFQMEEDALRAAEQDAIRADREALELRGQEYVNLAQAEGALDSAAALAAAFGQPDIEPKGPPPALEGIAAVLDSLKSGVIGGISGLLGWDIQGEDTGGTKFAVNRFVREEDIVGDRNRVAVAWDRALKGLFGGQSYGFGDFEALRYSQDDARSRRLVYGAAAFALDTAFDPLTYFSFGSSILGRIVASTGVRVASQKIAREVLESAGERVVRDQVERLSTRELAERVSRVTGEEFGELLTRNTDELAEALFRGSPDDFFAAAMDSWSFGNAAAYGSRGRTGLYDRLVQTVGQDLADDAWRAFPSDIRGGARIRVPFRRTVSEETGLRLPTIIQFPGSQPGRGFDRIGMDRVTRKMNEARLILRSGPFKFLENVSGKRGHSWTKVLQAARRGDAEAIEAYAVHFGTMAFDDIMRRFARNYDQMSSAGMHAIARQLKAASDSGLDQDEILQFLSELYFKRGRSDLPPISRPEHVVAADMVEHLFEMTDNVHRLAVEIYGEDAARVMQDYATRMLTDDGFQSLVDRYGRLEGRRGRLAEGIGRDNSSYPKTMELDNNGRLIVTEWMTPDEIKAATGVELFITDPVEAVGEYLMMMRRELVRDWSLKQLDEMGLLKSIGEDIIRQPTVRQVQSEVEDRMRNIRGILNRIEKGETVSELDGALLEAERAAVATISAAGRLVEIEPGIYRSSDGLVEIRQNRSGGWSAYVNDEPVLRPTISQVQAEELVPELQGPVREVDWDEVRRGFYDEQGNRIPARQVRMEGTDDPRWVTSTEPAAATSPARGPAVAPDADDARQISGTWEPWLRSGAEADLEYVHKILRHRIAVHEAGGRSVSRKAYAIHKRDLEILEELHPHLRNLEYDNAPVPASSVDPNAKYRMEVGPDGNYVIVENVPSGGVGTTTVARRNDVFELSNGNSIDVQKVGDSWEAVEVNPSAGTATVIMRGTNKKQLIEDVLERFPRTEAAPAVPAAPARRSLEEIAEDIGERVSRWEKFGSGPTQKHVAYWSEEYLPDTVGLWSIELTPVAGTTRVGKDTTWQVTVKPPEGQPVEVGTVTGSASVARKQAVEEMLPEQVAGWSPPARAGATPSPEEIATTIPIRQPLDLSEDAARGLIRKVSDDEYVVEIEGVVARATRRIDEDSGEPYWNVDFADAGLSPERQAELKAGIWRDEFADNVDEAFDIMASFVEDYFSTYRTALRAIDDFLPDNWNPNFRPAGKDVWKGEAFGVPLLVRKSRPSKDNVKSGFYVVEVAGELRLPLQGVFKTPEEAFEGSWRNFKSWAEVRLAADAELPSFLRIAESTTVPTFEGTPATALRMREQVENLVDQMTSFDLDIPEFRVALDSTMKAVREEFDRAATVGDPAAVQAAVESLDELSVQLVRRFNSLLRGQADVDVISEDLAGIARAIDEINSSMYDMGRANNVPGVEDVGARGPLEQRYYDVTNVWSDSARTRVFNDFDPPAKYAEQYNRISSTVFDVMRRASGGESPEGWLGELSVALGNAIDLSELDPLTGWAALAWRGKSESLVPEFKVARDLIENAQQIVENYNATSTLRAFGRNIPTPDEVVVPPTALSPSAKPAPRPTGPDAPAWELTLEEFEATGRTLYHGSPQDFDFFDSMAATYRGRGQRPAAGEGRFYFTDDPEVAGAFRQNIVDIVPEQWAVRHNLDLADLESDDIFLDFVNDVARRLEGGKLQIMSEEGAWIDVPIARLTRELVEQDVPMRAVYDRGQVVETRVFGREIDLTGNLSDLPEDLLEAMRLDGIVDFATGQPRVVGYRFQHERNFENTSAWMRENGYGRAVVPDAPESGGRSVIGLEEYIEYGRDVADIHDELTASFLGRASGTDVPPIPDPLPVQPGLKREYAGRYKYTRESGEQFDIDQVRPDGKAQVWRVTDGEGVDIGDFARREDAVAFLEGRPPTPPRQVVPPETRALVRQIRDAFREVDDIVRRLAEGDVPADAVIRTRESTDFLMNAFEILAFDNPALARRLLANVPEGPEHLNGAFSEFSVALSDIIESVVTRAPRSVDVPSGPGAQQAIGVAEGVGGAPSFTPSVPRSDFVDKEEAAYWANYYANRVRAPQARVVREEIWETNRQELIAKLQEDYTWLEAAVNDGNVLQNLSEEDFETWIERVITFLDGVDPSIDPYNNAVDKIRYSRAAREAGLERFTLAEVDPVVSAILKSEDLFGPEILSETIRRHFALSRDAKGAEKFYQDFWRPYYTASKSWMTQGRGYGYTARNIIGSMYNAWLADVGSRHFVHSGALLSARRQAREEADQILARRGVQEGETTVEAWDRVFYGALERNLKEGGRGFKPMTEKAARQLVDSYAAFTERAFGGRTARSRTWGELLDRGEFNLPVYGSGDVGRRGTELFPGRSIDELNRAQRIANTTIDNPWMRHVTRVNESAEDYLRFAAFLRGVDTYGLDDGGFGAGTWVIGTQFDYSDLSDFERRLMKNIIPFYTWTRYNVPLQVRSLWMEPGKVNRLLRFHEEVVKAWTGESKEDQQSLPEWLRRRGGWMTTMSAPMTDPETVLGRIFGLKEDPIAAFIESPLSDLGMLFNATLNPLQLVNMDEAINNLNPIVGRAAYEFLTGRSYVSGRELDPDALAPRWAAPWAAARGRRNEDGELVFSQNWAQAFRNLLPPFAQAERLFAPLFGDERQRRRWLTTLGSQVFAAPLYTVDPNQQAFAINSYARGVQDALRDGIISYEDRRDVANRLLSRGYTADQIMQLGLLENDPLAYNFQELDRVRRRNIADEQIERFLSTLDPGVAEAFIFNRGYRGLRGGEAVQAWQNRVPHDELSALFLPEVNMAFADWFSRLSESDKLGFVFQYGFGPYRGAEAVREWSTQGGLPNLPPNMGSEDFLS